MYEGTINNYEGTFWLGSVECQTLRGRLEALL